MNKSKTPELVKKYEEMLAKGASIYFDTDEFEDIAFYYELEELYQLAYETVCNGLTIHPGSNELMVKKALYLLCIEKPEEALQLIDSLHITNAQSLLIKADIYLANKKLDESLVIVDQVILESKPDFTLYLDVSDVFANNEYFDLAISYLKKGLEVFPDNSDLTRELAFTYGDSEQFELMVEALNQLLDANPYEISDWISLIRAYGSMNHLDKAIEACDFALAIDDKNEEVKMMRAVCLYENGNSDAAAAAFDECVTFESANTAFLIVVIQCFLELKRYDNALRVAERIIRDNPDSADGYYQQAICYIGLKDVGRAYECINDALNIDPVNPDFLVVKADLLTERNDYAEAKEILLALLEREPDFYKTYFPLGYIYEQEENWAKALEFYRKSYDQNPQDAVSLLKIVKLYYYTKDYKSTVEYKLLLDAAIDDPTNAEMLTNEYLLREYQLTDEYIKNIDNLLNNN